jgi:hypothetical protein
VGAGIHGCHIAVCLLATGVSPQEVVLLDRFSEPLQQWSQRTSRIGMQSLRSPAVHALDVSPWVLFERADQSSVFPFHPPYERPEYSFFQSHCQQLVDEYALTDRLLSCQVLRLELCGENFLVVNDRTPLLARRVVLAVGQPPLCRPAWAKDVPGIRHIFDSDWCALDCTPQVIVGGGLTAAQLALDLSRKGPVTLIHRHPWRVHQFDSDPCWMGPKCCNSSFFEASPERRRDLITRARHRGSITPEIHRKLQEAERVGAVQCLRAEVEAASDASLRLTDGSSLPYGQVTLATGFTSQRPGGALVEQAIASLGLPTSGCGFPIVGYDLQWRERLYVSGGLAELAVGPVARNIAGAREAALRILGPLHPRSEKRKRRLVSSL